METLSANEMFGRGYVNNGYELAATYVETQFKSLGLLPIGNSYRQEFFYPVNTFPDTVEVKIDGRTLKAGADFIVDPACPSFKGELLIVKVDFNKFMKKEFPLFSMKEILIVPVLPSKLSKDSVGLYYRILEEVKLKVNTIHLVADKLTWSVSGNVATKCNIDLLESSFDKNATKVFLKIKNKFMPEFKSSNVIGMIKSKRKKCKDFIVITAHLDHLGMMGPTATFNGANDNASGVASMLLLASHYAQSKPDFNVLFIAFGGEEAGLIGSKYFVDHPLIKLEKIKFLFNIDLMGNGEEGVTIVNATLFKNQFELFKKINEKNDYLTQVKPRGEAQNSDHYWFTKKGVPSFFMYTMGGTKAYHDVYDRPEQLPMQYTEALHKLMVAFFDEVVKLK